ncbi:winged helix-turn-helix transcriptional regulator [Streptomyces sp. NRRL S-350]|uniref:winged helix-turn-helix transcriptional regulator n=1 Tax=Streptomyces sp. NRRL S-350 TaxID=1463902 RepID=UPI00099C7095|nr:helix-turn-helix domain-containing protein [Streptomyces sp. NRRL S-350]
MTTEEVPLAGTGQCPEGDGRERAGCERVGCEPGDHERDEQEYSVFARLCPSREVFAELADKWSMLILMGLLTCGPQRFSELQRGVGGVSRKMLTQSLRNLERSGLVLRTVFPETPPRVVYDLLPLGRELAELLAPVGRWTEHRAGLMMAAREEFDAAHGEG